jgi:hypothetical protein
VFSWFVCFWFVKFVCFGFWFCLFVFGFILSLKFSFYWCQMALVVGRGFTVNSAPFDATAQPSTSLVTMQR